MSPVDGPVLDRDERKRAGAWYTPGDLAARILERALALASTPVQTACDPFCGGGAFLEAAAARGLSCLGVEQDPEVAAACRTAVPGAEVVAGDALLAPELGGVDWSARGAGFDMVVGNPPWEVLERSVHAPQLGTDYAAALRRSGFAFAGGGKLNLFRLALERGFSLLRPGGILAFLVPAGFLRDAGSAPLRHHFLEEGSFEEIWELSSGPELFPTAHRDLPICAVFVRRGGPTLRIRLDGGLLERETLTRFSPESHAIPALLRPGDAELLNKLMVWPRLADCVTGLRKGDVNLATDRELFRTRATPLVLRTGKEIAPFRLAGPPTRWVDPEGLAGRAAQPWTHERVVWRDVADVTLKKRMCAAIVPAGSVLGDTLNYLVPPYTAAEAAYWQAMLNSHAFEWLARLRSAHNHLGQAIVGSCPVPPWDPADPACLAIGAGNPISADALIARRYGLDPEEFGAILEAFPKQPHALKASLLTHARGHAAAGAN